MYELKKILTTVIFYGIFPLFFLVGYFVLKQFKNSVHEIADDTEDIWRALCNACTTPLRHSETENADLNKPYGSFITQERRHTTYIALRNQSTDTFNNHIVHPFLEVYTPFTNPDADSLTTYTGDIKAFDLLPPDTPRHNTGDQDFDRIFRTHTDNEALLPNNILRNALIQCTQYSSHLVTHADSYGIVTIAHCRSSVPLQSILDAHQDAAASIQSSALARSTQPDALHIEIEQHVQTHIEN